MAAGAGVGVAGADVSGGGAISANTSSGSWLGAAVMEETERVSCVPTGSGGVVTGGGAMTVPRTVTAVCCGATFNAAGAAACG